MIHSRAAQVTADLQLLPDFKNARGIENVELEPGLVAQLVRPLVPCRPAGQISSTRCARAAPPGSSRMWIASIVLPRPASSAIRMRCSGRAKARMTGTSKVVFRQKFPLRYAREYAKWGCIVQSTALWKSCHRGSSAGTLGRLAGGRASIFSTEAMTRSVSVCLATLRSERNLRLIGRDDGRFQSPRCGRAQGHAVQCGSVRRSGVAVIMTDCPRRSLPYPLRPRREGLGFRS